MHEVDRIRHDVREGLRRLARNPGLSLAVVGILGLGLSTSTAAFTYVNAYRQPIPGSAAEGLHQVWLATEESPWGPLSLPDFLDLTALDDAPFAVAGVGSGFFVASVRHEDLTEVAVGEAVTGDFFATLEIEMSLGRGLSADDDRPGSTPATVLSHDYWLRRYQGAADVAGRTILLNGQPYLIVGVAGPAFRGASSATRPSFWLPLEQHRRVYRPGPAAREDREPGSVVPILRLAAGVAPAAAQQVLDALARRLDQAVPLDDRTRRFVLEPARWISPTARDAEASTTRVMVAATGFLLLLACANVASLLLSAGAGRHAEVAIRTAMGAPRGRVVRQLVTESVLASLPAGLLALALAGPLSGRIASYFARPDVWGANVPREIEVDPRVMLFALGAAVAVGAATGLVPALRTSEASPAAVLGTRAAGASDRSSRRRLLGLRDLLVSAQVAICVVLLFVAALVLRTLDSARSVDAGFDVDRTVASYVSTSSMGVPVSERHAFYEQLMRRFEALPWVEAVTLSENAPLSGHASGRLYRDDGGDPVTATMARVWPGYVEAMSLEVRSGRAFVTTDTVNAFGVVLVNESLAARLSPDLDVVGRALAWPGEDGAPDRRYEIVGVVRDARQVTLLDAPGPVAYFSLPQQYSRPGNALLLRVRGDPIAAAALMERELRAVDSRLAIVNVLPYRDVVRGELYTQRMNAELFTAIAALGLLFCSVGVFAVLALAVAGRRREIGIRMAVGADDWSLVKAVMAPIGAAVLLGLGVGLAGAYGATRLVAGLLWGVTPADPLSLAAGVGVLLVVVSLSVGVPLRAALGTDPAAAVRAE